MLISQNGNLRIRLSAVLGFDVDVENKTTVKGGSVQEGLRYVVYVLLSSGSRIRVAVYEKWTKGKLYNTLDECLKTDPSRTFKMPADMDNSSAFDFAEIV